MKKKEKIMKKKEKIMKKKKKKKKSLPLLKKLLNSPLSWSPCPVLSATKTGTTTKKETTGTVNAAKVFLKVPLVSAMDALRKPTNEWTLLSLTWLHAIWLSSTKTTCLNLSVD